MAVGILADRGYEVAASTGKPDAEGFLKDLGATEIIGRDETSGPGKPLERERWAGAVDCVGASTLPYILRTLKYGGAVAASGNTGGIGLESHRLPVHPARCRACSASTQWRCRSSSGAPCGSGSPPTCVRAVLDDIGSREVSLAELPSALDDVLAGAEHRPHARPPLRLLGRATRVTAAPRVALLRELASDSGPFGPVLRC